MTARNVSGCLLDWQEQMKKQPPKKQPVAENPRKHEADCASCKKELFTGDVVYRGDAGQWRGKIYCYECSHEIAPYGFFDLIGDDPSDQLKLIP